MHDPTPDRPRRSPGPRRASRTERDAASGAPGERVEPSAALTPIEAALADAFEALAAAGVPVLALRGARDAPQYRGGGDLDLACRPRDLAKLRATLLADLRRLGVVVVSEHRQPFLLQLQLYAACGPGRHHHLCVDIHTAETCYGLPFLDAEELLAGARADELPMRPAAVVGALLDFLTPYLSARFVDPEYGARLEVVAEVHPVLLRSLLGRLVDTRRADRFVAALRAKAPAGPLAREAAAFRRALLGRAVRHRPLGAARGFLGCLWSARVAPLLRPRGMTVGLLGTDGTGKTTLGEALLEELRPSFRSSLNRIHKLRPGLLPQLGRFLGRQQSADEYARPHRATPSGTLGTWVRATYYWLDYTLGYPLVVLPLRRRNTLLVLDRWIDDWLVDPARYRMRPGSRYVRWLTRLAPRPDVTLVASAPLRTVRARKYEVDGRECLRQLEAYEDLARHRDDVFVISTAGSIEDALDRAQYALFFRIQPMIPQLGSVERTLPAAERKAA